MEKLDPVLTDEPCSSVGNLNGDGEASQIGADAVESGPAHDALDGEQLVLEPRDGAIQACGTQLLDYISRDCSEAFNNMCVYDFVANVELERVGKTKLSAPSPRNDSGEHHTDEDGHMAVQNVKTRGRPLNARSTLSPIHPQHKDHQLRLRSPGNECIPVPIGPSLLRRDKPELLEKYCRTMLILFKPWKHPKDLRSTGQSWKAAFDTFLPHMSPSHRAILDNMQRLHECKDSRDEDFAARRVRVRGDNQRDFSNDLINVTTAGLRDDDLGHEDFEMLAMNLDQIMGMRTRRRDAVGQDAEDVVHIGEAAGLFDALPSQSLPTWPSPSLRDAELEANWRAAYEQNKVAFKESLRPIPPTMANPDAVHAANEANVMIGTLMMAHESPHGSNNPSDGVLFVPATKSVGAAEGYASIEEYVEKFTLNPEQAHAFRTVAEHSLVRDGSRPPLRMLMHGPGGTGKSRIIEALSAFFESRDETRRLRLLAFTGVAARNISGMTLHMALQLSQLANMRKTTASRSRKELIELWTGVDYLFIDEVSMVGLDLLTRLNEAMNIVKAVDDYSAGNEDVSIFGNMSVIFAGDFCQLKPVKDASLFAPVEELTRTYKDSQTVHGQNKLMGKQLWLNVNSVVMLHRSMRQSGDANRAFRELLSRLRYGNCTQADVALLQTRILGSARVDMSSPEWQNAPVVVSNNAVKDAWNQQAVQKFAHKQGREVQHYVARDSHNGKLITDSDLRAKLYDLHTGETSHLVGRLGLVEGMKVIVGLNYDVGSGVVNGSEGILKKVFYTLSPNGERYASSAVVHIPDSGDGSMPHLQPHEKVVFCKTKTFTFCNVHTGESMSITRQQLPLDAAYAITDYKSQGKTLEHVIVDIQSSRIIQSIYVMVSRATSLDGLVILRPFDPKKVRAHAPQSLRDELVQLETLSYHTILASSSESARHEWTERALTAQPTQGGKRKRLETFEDPLDYGQPTKKAHVIRDVPIPLSSLFDEMEVA